MIKSIIVATSINRVIGYKNRLPWHMPADLSHFKKLTYNHWVIMGRSTFTSLPYPLRGRKIVVLSRDKTYHSKDCKVTSNLEAAFEMAQQAAEREVFIAGGSQVYQQALQIADKIYWTLIKAEIAGDAFFPLLPYKEWREISRVSYEADKQHPYEYDFIELIHTRNFADTPTFSHC